MLKKLNGWDQLVIISLAAIMLLNPITGQYILAGVENVLIGLMDFGPLVIAAPIAYLIGYAVNKLKPIALNIPKKAQQ